jgi:hypothetical protein
VSGFKDEADLIVWLGGPDKKVTTRVASPTWQEVYAISIVFFVYRR